MLPEDKSKALKANMLCVCVTAVMCATPGKIIKTYNKMDQHFKICIILKAQILVLIPYVLEVYI